MTIIVEDGSIVTGANSYVSGEDLVAYAAARGVTIPPPTQPGPSPVAPTTSYANAEGAGDRTSTVIVTSDIIWGDGYSGNPLNLLAPVSNLVDGSFSGAVAGSILFPYTVFVDESYIEFDFGAGVKKYIDVFRITAQGASSVGTWRIDALDDNDVWVTQKSSFTWIRGTALEYSFTPTLTIGFRKWRMIKESTDGSVSNWCTEFDFKIAPGAAEVPEVTDSTAEDLIIKAMDYTEGLSFKGIKFTQGQGLQWPRANVYVDGYFVATTEIPAELVKGLNETCLAINGGEDPLADVPRVQTEVKVGSLGVKYATGSSSTTLVKKISNAFRKLLTSAGGSSFEVKR